MIFALSMRLYYKSLLSKAVETSNTKGSPRVSRGISLTNRMDLHESPWDAESKRDI